MIRTRDPLTTIASSKRRSRRESVAAFALYLAGSLILLDRGLIGQSHRLIGGSTDLSTYMWFMKWWPYAISHGRDPFLTDLLWAPLGVNLAWVTSIPLPTLVTLPVQLTLGEFAAYNWLCTLALPGAAFSAFLLCRRVTGEFWPSFCGGYVFGFSSYMLGQVCAHAVLVITFPVPLAVLLALKQIDGEISSSRFSVLLATLLVAEFLSSVELFATLTLAGALALLLALGCFEGAMRARLFGLIAPTITAYLTAAIVVSPYLYHLFAYGFPHEPIWTPDRFSADVIGFLVPEKVFALGTPKPIASLTRLLSINIPENGAYLGLPLIVFGEAFRRRYWPTPVGKMLTILLTVIVIAAMGPVLHIAGRPSLMMPWAFFVKLPLISSALPIRFMMYAFLVIAVMLAIWLTSAPTGTKTKLITVAIIAVSLMPNPKASFWVSTLEIPAFFTRGTYRAELAPGDIVLPLPFGKQGTSMYWQAKSDMYFRMAGGWTGVVPFPFARMPIVNFFEGADDLPEPGEQLKTFIAHFGVKAVIADPADLRFQIFQPVLASLSVPSVQVDGIWLYKIARNEIADHENVNPARAEARAIALRFDTILPAAAKYIASGRDPAMLSAIELKRSGLLPSDWQVRTAQYTLADWSIGMIDKRIAIALHGSYDGLKPLIDRLSMQGAEILYPAPTPWNPRAIPDKELLGTMLALFDREKFDAAVASLKASPPLEMTTPFLIQLSR
jgi:hypothetical protein